MKSAERGERAEAFFDVVESYADRAAGVDGEDVAGTGNALRLASHQVAKRFFHAGTFARVVVFADGAGLAAEFEAENIIFEVVEAAADFVVNVGDGFDCGARRFRR